MGMKMSMAMSECGHPAGRLVTNTEVNGREANFIYAAYAKAGIDLGFKVEMLDDAYDVNDRLIDGYCAIVITSGSTGDLGQLQFNAGL